MTKTELARLVRRARGMSSLHLGPGRREFYCPVHSEALHRAGERSLPHRFEVVVSPWHDPTRVAAVAAALRQHLDDALINDEPCDQLDRERS